MSRIRDAKSNRWRNPPIVLELTAPMSQRISRTTMRVLIVPVWLPFP